jgi:hypothetical protein
MKEDIDELQYELRRLFKLHNAVKRYTLPKETYENYFMEFIDEGFKYSSTNTDLINQIMLYGTCDLENVENTFNGYLNRLDKIKVRLDSVNGLKHSHFKISLNGVSQCDWNPKTYKNDLYVFKGVVESISERDEYGRPSKTENPNKVAVNIYFVIV